MSSQILHNGENKVGDAMVKDNPVIESDLKNIYQKLSALESAICDALLLLRGNGDPSKGIVVRLDRLEQWQIAHAKDHEQKGKDWRAIVFPIITSLMTALVSGGIVAWAMNKP